MNNKFYMQTSFFPKENGWIEEQVWSHCTTRGDRRHRLSMQWQHHFLAGSVVWTSLTWLMLQIGAFKDTDAESRMAGKSFPSLAPLCM